MTDSKKPSLLIVGGTKTGKTHFGGQLLRRLETKKYPLRIVGAPSDLTPFKEVLESLADGRSAPHTPTSFYRESVWDVHHQDQGYESQLIWPDYGGEQIEDIVTKRHITEPWIDRIRESTGWLFLVRTHLIAKPEDILTRPRQRDHMADDSKKKKQQPMARAASGQTSEPAEVTPRLNLSTQAGLVELLQALLFVKQIGRASRLSQPSLILLLSCLDELQTDFSNGQQTPRSILRGRLPILSQFIESTWDPYQVDVIGLSALGKALNSKKSDEDFKENGPERQGWCLQADGQVSNDLTLPVLALMENIRRVQ